MSRCHEMTPNAAIEGRQQDIEKALREHQEELYAKTSRKLLVQHREKHLNLYNQKKWLLVLFCKQPLHAFQYVLIMLLSSS